MPSDAKPPDPKLLDYATLVILLALFAYVLVTIGGSW